MGKLKWTYEACKKEAAKKEKELIKLAKKTAHLFGYTVVNKSSGGTLGGLSKRIKKYL